MIDGIENTSAGAFSKTAAGVSGKKQYPNQSQ